VHSIQSHLQDIYPLEIQIVHTDNSSKFMGEFNNLLDLSGINQVKCRPYNSKCQGAVEAFNNTIQAKIKTYKNDFFSNGVKFNLANAVKDSLNYYNNQHRHSRTKQIPNQLFYYGPQHEVHKQRSSLRVIQLLYTVLQFSSATKFVSLVLG